MNETSHDVIIIGGAFAGASTAVLLRRFCPQSRVLVVERESAFDGKVGEATVEVSGFFLHTVLGLYDYLSREQLPKHGLRYWFTDGPERSLAEMSEVGPTGLPRLPAFQLDRAKIDERLLELAVEEGAELLRPAKVAELELGWPQSKLRVETAEGSRELTARWVIDASGRHAFIARRLRLHQRVEEHPTAAVWARWEGVADLDGPEVVGPDPRQPKLPRVAAARRLATNHFCGHGYWCWVIPLSGGKTSIGVVYDKRLFSLPGEGSLLERYRAFCNTHPGLRELAAGARIDEEDFRSYSHLPYRSSRYLDMGWALVGDAAGFIDPYYSPGLDHVSITAYTTARLIEDDLLGRLAGDALTERVAEQNRQLVRSFGRWLDALYVGKYQIMGDAELTAAAMMLDTALYYLGVVTPILRQVEPLRNPVFGLPIPQATWAYHLVRGINRRLQRLAELRRRAGTYGRRNVGWRVGIRTPDLGMGALGMLRQGLGIWLGVELSVLGDRLTGRRAPAPAVQAQALASTADAV